jgi:hypothetical protein
MFRVSSESHAVLVIGLSPCCEDVAVPLVDLLSFSGERHSRQEKEYSNGRQGRILTTGG